MTNIEKDLLDSGYRYSHSTINEEFLTDVWLHTSLPYTIFMDFHKDNTNYASLYQVNKCIMKERLENENN